MMQIVLKEMKQNENNQYFIYAKVGSIIHGDREMERWKL